MRQPEVAVCDGGVEFGLHIETVAVVLDGQVGLPRGDAAEDRQCAAIGMFEGEHSNVVEKEPPRNRV